MGMAGEPLMSMPQSYEVSLLDEERYKLLVDAISDYAIYMLDTEGRIASWNAGAQRFKGYEPWEILGEHFSRFYTDEDRLNRLPERAINTATTEGRFENEGWRVRKDGSRFWAHVIIDPIWDRSGDLLGFAKVTRDLTERKKAEAELKQSEDKFQILVQGVTDYALYMLSPEGYVSNWNLGAERIKGYLAEEIIGKHFSQFYTSEDRDNEEPAKSLETARREGRVEKEGWRQRKDGTRFWAHVVIDAIRNDQDVLIGFAKITRDVTEKLETQKALTKAREELFQAQKMEAIGQLTGGIAHDFNNLLMAILGSLEMLRKRLPDDPTLLPLLDNAIQGGERGAALTQRMLAFSRRQELNMKAVGLVGLIDGMMDFLQRSLGSAVRIETDVPADIAVVTDPVQLETALLNLIVNARDAMGSEGTVTITADERLIDETDGKLKPGRYVCLSVADTGEGMDQETLDQATTPFFTTKGIGKGTGLGLSMVQGLTEQSGGRISITSKKGVGTTISLLLPAADAGASLAADEPAAPAAVGTPTRNLTVLAVDDDALVLMNTTMMLEELGHTVIEAYNGAEALDILRDGAQTIDIVITDHSMPRMTGSELAAEVRRTWPAIPVVLATGYAELPSGGDARLPRLPKPFSQGQLQDAITSVLNGTA
jgi:PAS domain S-box-containing protein